jgi:serine/threonine-protein phosphatase 2A catalytic subunit
VSALVEGRILGMHGGLSTDFRSLDEVRQLERVQDIPQEGGLYSDLVWSDPDDRPGVRPNPRGAGILFGPDVTSEFMRANGLTLIARAHQLMQDGYLTCHGDALVTLFSAPNYCYRCNNLAAFMECDEHLQTHYLQFDPCPRRG